MSSELKVFVMVIVMLFILAYTCLIYNITKCQCDNICIKTVAKYKEMGLVK